MNVKGQATDWEKVFMIYTDIYRYVSQRTWYLKYVVNDYKQACWYSCCLRPRRSDMMIC